MTTTALTDTDRQALAAEQATSQYRDFLAETLAYAVTRTQRAQQELNEARATAAVDAAIAVRAGYGKTATANALGISRPTLDAWLAMVDGETDLRQRVEQHELFVARRLHKP